MSRNLVVVLGALVGVGLVTGLAHAPTEAPASGPGVRFARTPRPAFARAAGPQPFHWPRDHGPHFEFETEWWYYTGNLETDDGRRYGFQLTFFRRGLSPDPPAPAGLATNQIYFAHFAITDVTASRHRFAERWSRGAAGLAGASAAPFRIWLEDWSAEGRADAVKLRARDGELDLELELTARKPIVAQGFDGFSPKSDESGNASYYVSYTRMAARGRIGDDEVGGEAWFDHEWSTSALGPAAVGWDWWSLQLDDGRELMYFQIRRSDGHVDAATSGTFVAKDGSARRLGPADVRVEITGKFTSPETRAEYPSRWRLHVPSEGLILDVVPLVRDQEMRTSFTYWEGAVQLEGKSRGAPVAGRGYVELTGYARSMQGVF